ncbi:MAG: class I adenylate-forming enzyme family protein [Nostocoides sp.]
MIDPTTMDGVRTGREAWARRVRLSASQPFLLADGQVFTYGEVHERAARYAGALVGLGVELGTRVMVGLSNRAETMVLHVALLQLGAVAVPLQGGLTFEELAYQIHHCEARILIADAPVTETLAPRLAELPQIRVFVADGTMPTAASPPTDPSPTTLPLRALEEGPRLPWRELPGHGRQSPALILYTSGSTGRPKGVILPSGAFPSAGAAFNDRFGFGPADTYFLPLTMAHALGVLTAPAMAVMAGGGLSIVDGFSPTRFWSQVAHNGSTASILVPTHLNLLLETADAAGPVDVPTSLRLVITHAWNEPFRARFSAELALVWGMTETGALCTGGAPGHKGERDGFVGTPMTGVHVETRDETGQAQPPGQAGEICLHHPDAMIGYLKDPDATAATLEEGWVRSGDLGVLDERGALTFLGRIKNMIKRSGENISAEEVEAAFTALPGVSECLAFGIPDRIRHEEVAVVVVCPEPIPPAELIAQVAQSLARWKVPRFLAMQDLPLPRLGNGKVDRTTAQQDFDPSCAYDRHSASSGRGNN